ncbi:MAG TPA: DUF6538 domain-containing protein [Gammaproteobacteria bacterium]
MNYLTRREGTLWFQIRVPASLVPRYGTMIRQCLRTADLSIAQPIALQLAGQWLARFASEKHDPATDTAVPPASAPAVPPVDPHHPYAMPDPQAYWQGQAHPPQPYPYGHGYPPSAMPPQVPQGYYPPVPPMPAPVSSAPAAPAKPSKTKARKDALQTMDDVLGYWRRMRPDLSKSTCREVEAVVKEFKKVVRKRPAELERLDIAAYRDKLISAGRARGTISKKVGFISTLLQAAYDAGYLPSNVARGLRIPKAKVPDVTRRSFTTDELRRIFASPVYTKGKRLRSGGGEAIVWVPMIALATGARMEEICQLRVDDIYLDSEHGPLLRITDEGEGQSLKTASSRRIIPIHPDLVRAGLLDYHEAVGERGHGWLFPALEPDHDGRRSGTFGQGFSRYLRSSRGCHILDKRVVFHSFRHTFKTLCREAELSEELHDALTGHVGQTVGRTYGHMPLSALVKAVARIRFPIEFPRIEA